MTMSVVMHGASDQDEDEVDGPFFACSVSSWSELGRWVRGLPDTDGSLPELMEFAEEGEVTDTRSLAIQLGVASEVYPPDPGVRETILRLLEVLGDGDEDEMVQVVEG